MEHIGVPIYLEWEVFKKKYINTHTHTHFIPLHYTTLQAVVINCYQLLSVVINCCSLYKESIKGRVGTIGNKLRKED